MLVGWLVLDVVEVEMCGVHDVLLGQMKNDALVETGSASTPPTSLLRPLRDVAGAYRLHRLAHQRGGQIGDEGRDRQDELADVLERSPLGEGFVLAMSALSVGAL